MTDSRKLRDRAWAHLSDIFRGMDSEPKIMIPLIVSGLIMFFCALRLFAEKVPLESYIQNCGLAGAAFGWVLGCAMVIICFCIQLEEQTVVDAKLNFGCGIITAIVVFCWFVTITVVFLAPVAWLFRQF